MPIAFAWAWFDGFTERNAPQAQKQAEQNIIEFLTSLANRVNRLEKRVSLADGARRHFEKALNDPDFSATLRTALIGAARSSETRKQAILARAVTERLTAEAESLEAIASNLAAEAVPRLALKHLELLRLMALVHSIRPIGIPLPDSPPEGVAEHDTSPGELNTFDRYTPWLRQATAPISVEPTISDYAHLVSAGCAVFERQIKIDVLEILRPTGKRFPSFAASGGWWATLHEFLSSDEIGRNLTGLWEGGLREIRPTPVGLLIGTAVHDVEHDTETSVNWQLVNSNAEQYREDPAAVWDGSRIERKFMEALEGEIEERIRLRVRTWSRILKGG